MGVPRYKTDKFVMTVGTVFVLVSLLCLYDICLFVKDAIYIKNNYIDVPGVVTEIIPHRTHSSENGTETTYTVMVKYEVEGREYENPYDYYTAGMHPGSTVTVHCDPESPEKHDSTKMVDIIVFIVFAAVFGAVGTASLVWQLRKKFRLDGVVARGKYVICYDPVEKPSGTRVNRVRYNLIACTYAAENGRTYYFASEPFHPKKSPMKYLTHGVKVYVDIDEDATLYCVSFEEL